MKRLLASIPIISLVVLASCGQQGTPTTEDSTAAATTTDTTMQDPLPSWVDGNAKERIETFVKNTTTEGNADFVPVKDRIATFDNDGCLWSEQPYYFQLAFALDEIKRMAPEHPEWKSKQPFKAVLEGDMKTVMAGGMKSLAALIMASHTGLTAEEFDAHVKNWMATATHPKSGKHYNEMIFQPMVELLAYLRANGYKTFIVSGGGIDFMRAWAEDAYGIPPYQVVGSVVGSKYVASDNGAGQLFKTPDLVLNDDKEGKPVGIYRSIGKRPVFAAGNSDGDYQMLQYTTTGSGPRFGMIVHHTDSTREVAYDSASAIGHLQKALVDAPKYNWLVVDMKNDWKKIYPFQ